MRSPLLVLAGLLAFSSAQASIVISGNLATGGTFTVTSPISFTVTSPNVGIMLVVFDNWVVTPDATTTVPLPIVIQKNGSNAPTGDRLLFDNYGSTYNDWGPTDGLIHIELATSLAVNDVVTLPAGSYSIPGNANLNPAIVQTFNGNAYLTDSSGFRISNITPVPEPSLSQLGLAGGLVLLKRRRR